MVSFKVRVMRLSDQSTLREIQRNNIAALRECAKRLIKIHRSIGIRLIMWDESSSNNFPFVDCNVTEKTITANQTNLYTDRFLNFVNE